MRAQSMAGNGLSMVADGVSSTRMARWCCVWCRLVVGISCVAAVGPVLAETWRLSSSVSATETYTSNVNYTTRSLAEGDFATTLNGTLSIHGEGPRLKLHGSIGATGVFYLTETQNNSFAPSANLNGTLEAIENFAYLDAQAYVSQTFQSPFGAQPADLVNATQNRYTQQTYSVSPYIKGVLGSTGISYQLRDDNYWTIASNYGNSSTGVPNTYSNALSASLNSPMRQLGWTLEYNRLYYDGGITGGGAVGQDTYTTQQIRLLLPYQIDPQLQIGARVGYEKNQFPLQDTTDTIYGLSVRWSPTPRTNVAGFWEHRFFGSSYSLQASHRLPNAALTANLSRGISSYPQLALSIPAGAIVSQFVDLAFQTRIPDPVERAVAVNQFLATSGLPTALASPVNFYSPSITLQDAANLSLVLIGVRNSLGLSVFYLKSDLISAAGNVLPPALSFGQNNTQTGAGLHYSHSLGWRTNLVAGATYSTTTVNTSSGPLANGRSNNVNANVGVNTQFGPKTSGSAGVSYSWSNSDAIGTTGNISSLNVFVSVSHTF
jgi:uncharacterized protein (PEP-CTERM system associated)